MDPVRAKIRPTKWKQNVFKKKTPQSLLCGNSRSQISQVGRPFLLVVERELVVSRMLQPQKYYCHELKRHKRQGVQGYGVEGGKHERKEKKKQKRTNPISNIISTCMNEKRVIRTKAKIGASSAGQETSYLVDLPSKETLYSTVFSIPPCSGSRVAKMSSSLGVRFGCLGPEAVDRMCEF